MMHQCLKVFQIENQENLMSSYIEIALEASRTSLTWAVR